MGNKLPTPPLHSTHDENLEEAASNSSVSTDSEDSATDSSDEVDLEAEGEEASLLTNGPAYYNMFLGLEKEEDECVNPNVKKRRGAKGVVYYNGEQGQPVVVPPTRSVWYGMYVEHPQLDSPRFHKRFRRRFRMPYQAYKDHLEELKESPHFERWKEGKTDCVGRPAAPLALLLLTALRYLSRGWTFDDLSEATAISEEVIRVFFHRYIEFGSTTLFQKYVLAPTTLEHAKQQGNEYTMAGLAGAVGSMDATHVLCHKVEHKLRQSHLGFKLNGTARTYNLVCNHRRRILSTTTGHPARWNDKTIVKFDSFVMGLYNGDNVANVPFELYEYNERQEVTKREYRGAWLLTDNGYHKWSTTVPPYKSTTSRREIRFSEWLESMRKDVECTFGILKGRWRILKTGITIQSVADANKIWKTCCALHNMLLEVDGLDEKWQDGVPSHWEGDGGNHDATDVRFAISRINNPGRTRNYDPSAMGPGNDRDTDVPPVESIQMLPHRQPATL
ncbi:DDE superfamily endonuclease [Nitzschia inconspicua]|uniref:DDE superfamily endonuclease n=1 Tax=Nitzschia inconspicua TaxID=303405 RepID=A0A9K3PFK7_9STRA|nr:DDE superfamily endonuclease [Nitzschia inconspicua]